MRNLVTAKNNLLHGLMNVFGNFDRIIQKLDNKDFFGNVYKKQQQTKTQTKNLLNFC